jgi:D-beta-D-heptose 7-phosphate kinase/D-beta-D-heptose 1-phosphate adenosyltransferase
VVSVDDSDGTVCEALERIRPNVFANGGLRNQKNTPERELCERLDIRMVWGIGGGEGEQYSLNLRERIKEVGNGS